MKTIRKYFKKLMCYIAVVLVVTCAIPDYVFAAEVNDLVRTGEDDTSDDSSDVFAPAEAIPIYDYEDLQMMRDNPEGNYVLQNDIDCSGYEWEPLDFYGVFDGNNHALLNLKITKMSSQVRTTYDGNMIAYDTSFSGFFGVLENATVENLIIRGIDVSVESDKDCFIGTMAGYAYGSTIDSCDIQGYADLSVFAKMFGVGGIVGYGGNSCIINSNADVVLVCTDTNAAERDEQFMAGAYAAGYIDLDNDTIIIDGYDSDHGYVHNGGLVGMYILYGEGMNYAGYITNSRSEGMITFFEDNTDRRAYCSEYIGEVMNWTYDWGGCTSTFVRNEVFDYDTDLKPHYCENATYSEVVNDSTDTEYGYTLCTCDICGTYSYKKDFKPLKHNVTEWEILTEATTEDTGLKVGECEDCHTIVYEKIPVLEEVNETVSADSVSADVAALSGGESNFQDKIEEFEDVDNASWLVNGDAFDTGSNGGINLKKADVAIGIGLGILAIIFIIVRIVKLKKK